MLVRNLNNLKSSFRFFCSTKSSILNQRAENATSKTIHKNAAEAYRFLEKNHKYVDYCEAYLWKKLRKENGMKVLQEVIAIARQIVAEIDKDFHLDDSLKRTPEIIIASVNSVISMEQTFQFWHNQRKREQDLIDLAPSDSSDEESSNQLRRSR